jgi:hypothetical protein
MLLATGACETATPSAAAGIVRTAVRVARECGSVAVFSPVTPYAAGLAGLPPSRPGRCGALLHPPGTARPVG